MSTCDKFTTAREQFGFQQEIAVQQALLQAHANAEKGLTEIAVLDLAKAYDKVNRIEVLHIAERCLSMTELNMMRAGLGPMLVWTNNDPTVYKETLTRGVPRGAPSSPVYFKMYADDLLDTEQRWTGRVEGDTGSR